MKRRKVLKQIGFGLTAGIALPSWLSACKQDDDPKPEIEYSGTVVIIGAGAAGLYAADILRAKGVNATVLEASNRIGGRIRSLRPFDKPQHGLSFTSGSKLGSDFPIELGADRIAGSESIWAKFIKQQKVNTVPLLQNTDYYFLDNQLVPQTQALADSDFVAAQTFFDNLKNYNGANVSVQQAIEAAGINARVHNILNARIGNKYGTSNNRLGIIALTHGHLVKTWDGEEMLLGNNPMADVLIASFNRITARTELNTYVKNIDYQGERITLTGEKSNDRGVTEPFTIQADKVIITVPVSVLKEGDMTFTPALPTEKIIALSRMGMDASLRVLLDFKQNFWGDDVRYLYGGEVAPEYFNSGVGRSALTRTMSITINGLKAEELSALPGASIVSNVLNELDSVYDGKASVNIRKDAANNFIAVVQDWMKEPYIKGSVAYIKPGGTNDDRSTLAQPVEDRLFFAGEATDTTGEFATVNGALLSAERVVEEVIESITKG